MADQTKTDPTPGQTTVREMAAEVGYAQAHNVDEEDRESLFAFAEALETRLISMIDDVGEAMTQIYGIASESVIGDDRSHELGWAKMKLQRIANIAEAREPDEEWTR